MVTTGCWRSPSEQPERGWIARTSSKETLGGVLFGAAPDRAADEAEERLVMAFHGRLAPWAQVEAPPGRRAPAAGPITRTLTVGPQPVARSD